MLGLSLSQHIDRCSSHGSHLIDLIRTSNLMAALSLLAAQEAEAILWTGGGIGGRTARVRRVAHNIDIRHDDTASSIGNGGLMVAQVNKQYQHHGRWKCDVRE